jgi:methylase of polypeptide subunit release factors
LNKEILDFLKECGSDEYTINRLVVSAFLLEKNIVGLKNEKINNLVIQKDELEYIKLLDFLEIIKKINKNFCFEELLELFEFVISPLDKLVNGAIYTPIDIRQYITKQSFQSLDKKFINKVKVVDIACGCGGFLIDASKELKAKTNKSYKKIFQENIYGVDIQKYSVERTEILLSLLAISENEDEKEFTFNIYQGDSLKYDWKETRFDLILGNPPYVCSRNMDNETKESMKEWSTCRTGHPDLYIPFFQIGYELLKDNGILGYITVNSFINSVNGRAIREYFEKQKALLKIVDFGDEQIFQSKMTYTCLCFIQKKSNDSVFYAQEKSNRLEVLKEIEFIEEKYKDLDSFKGWSLKDNSFVKEMESQGKPFGEIYDTKSGIATLKNHVYIFKPIDEDEEYYYLDKDTPIEKTVCKDIINSNKLAKYDKFEELVEKIIFLYKHNKDGKPIFIKKDEFQKKYPKAYKYLLKHKELLAMRDKGNGKYPNWYAFGRSQSLEKRKDKLFFPQLVKKGFKTFYNNDENLYFYNGMCAYASKKELMKLQKIMESDMFWKYIENKAKHYASGYYGLGRNYLKDFGIIEK